MLRKSPNVDLLDQILGSYSFRIIYTQIFSVKVEQDAMINVFLRETSLLLALVSSVREGDTLRHLQAEHEKFKQVFAVEHQNYSRYLTYQHIILNDLQQRNTDEFLDLKNNAFGAN